MKKLVLALSVVGAVGAAALMNSDAGAGEQNSPFADCYFSSSYGGYCLGTFQGFRQSSNGSDFAEMETDPGGGWANFYATYQGTSYSCYTTSGSSVVSSLTAGTAGNWFFMSWNGSGQCTDLFFGTLSDYSRSW
jgi:hypothetical protein